MVVALLASAAPAVEDARCARALLVARRSRCPSGVFKNERLSLALQQRQEPNSPLVYFNAGANKGFAVAEFLQRFDGARAANSPSNADWYKSIRAIKPSGMFQCGMCAACKDAPAPRYSNSSTVSIVAFELLKGNHWLLNQLFERHHVPGVALNVAVSNYTGVAWAPTGVRTGQEWSSAELGGSAEEHGKKGNGRSRKGLTAVPSITIDGYARKEGLRRIHWLSIDAEGWDALIVEGARQLLEARRVDVLEFEYHSKGMWAASRAAADRRDLKAVLHSLDAAGYTCFWQGDSGALAQASGAAWCDAFEIRVHSNLVCSHVPAIVDALRAVDCAATSPTDNDESRRRHCAAVDAHAAHSPRKQHRAAYAD